MYFNDLSDFSREWESAFRLRRRERIEVQAPTFLALRFHFLTPFFATNFSVFGTSQGTPKCLKMTSSAAEAGPP